jgi:hypothetical protein
VALSVPGYRPGFVIVADDVDITGALMDRLVTLRAVDESTGRPDTLTFTVNDKGGKTPIPPLGKKLELWLGYIEPEDTMLKVGTYAADEYVLTGPPFRMIVQATAAKMLTEMKAPKTATYHDTTIGRIMDEVAKKYSLEAITDKALADVVVPHRDQTEESDLNFVTRLAEQYGAVAKPAYGEFRFVMRNDGTTAEVKYPIQAKWITNWRADYNSRNKYVAVIAHYRDLDKAELVPVRVGQKTGFPVKTMRHPFPDLDQATAAATAELERLQRGEGKLRLSMPGIPDLKANDIIVLDGIRDGVDGEWLCTRIEHIYAESGYRLKVEAETPKVKT